MRIHSTGVGGLKLGEFYVRDDRIVIRDIRRPTVAFSWANTGAPGIPNFTPRPIYGTWSVFVLIRSDSIRVDYADGEVGQ